MKRLIIKNVKQNRQNETIPASSQKNSFSIIQSFILFTHSIIQSFSHSLIASFPHFPHSIIQSFNHSVIQLFQSFQSFSHSIILLISVMYIILVYDIGEKRVGKMLKLCRQYLNWIQNSVFEGEITEVKLKELVLKAKAIMELEEDSVIIFKTRQEKWLEKQIVGIERSGLDQIL
jgi:CRISPR-associated protein Cas2